jgi:hypothetical protein
LLLDNLVIQVSNITTIRLKGIYKKWQIKDKSMSLLRNCIQNEYAIRYIKAGHDDCQFLITVFRD